MLSHSSSNGSQLAFDPVLSPSPSSPSYSSTFPLSSDAQLRAIIWSFLMNKDALHAFLKGLNLSELNALVRLFSADFAQLTKVTHETIQKAAAPTSLSPEVVHGILFSLHQYIQRFSSLLFGNSLSVATENGSTPAGLPHAASQVSPLQQLTTASSLNSFSRLPSFPQPSLPAPTDFAAAAAVPVFAGGAPRSAVAPLFSSGFSYSPLSPAPSAAHLLPPPQPLYVFGPPQPSLSAADIVSISSAATHPSYASSSPLSCVYSTGPCLSSPSYVSSALPGGASPLTNPNEVFLSVPLRSAPGTAPAIDSVSSSAGYPLLAALQRHQLQTSFANYAAAAQRQHPHSSSRSLSPQHSLVPVSHSAQQLPHAQSPSPATAFFFLCPPPSVPIPSPKANGLLKSDDAPTGTAYHRCNSTPPAGSSPVPPFSSSLQDSSPLVHSSPMAGSSALPQVAKTLPRQSLYITNGSADYMVPAVTTSSSPRSSSSPNNNDVACPLTSSAGSSHASVESYSGGPATVGELVAKEMPMGEAMEEAPVDGAELAGMLKAEQAAGVIEAAAEQLDVAEADNYVVNASDIKGAAGTISAQAAGVRATVIKKARHQSGVVGVKWHQACNAWVATWRSDGRCCDKKFAVRKYGFEEARRLAILHRYKVLEEGVAVSCTSKSGVKGVFYDHQHKSWAAHWRLNGDKYRKWFSVKTYGFEQARDRAIRCRIVMERKHYVFQ